MATLYQNHIPTNGVHQLNGSMDHLKIGFQKSDLYRLKELQLSDSTRSKQIKEFLKDLILCDDKSRRIAEVFESEINQSLAMKASSLQMENTYIPELPNGTEEGSFLALDLGGTNFRVILLEIAGGQTIREEVKRYNVSDEAQLGCGIELFDYLAACVEDFVKEKGLEGQELPMGFTFSFPMKQHSLSSAELITWTKGFNCTSVVGRDVVELLQESLEKRGLDYINVLCILNDTTGTLVQGASLDRRAKIGVILGTGSNAAFLERADRVKHWEGERHGEKNVIIDTEWGAFGDNGTLDFIKTRFDEEVNLSAVHRSFTFEKYISGKYLGEVARVVLKSLMEEGLLFNQAPRQNFPSAWKFGTDNVSKIELDTILNTNTNTIEVLKKFNFRYQIDYNDEDINVIQCVCELVSHRAAKLVSINTAILLNRLNDDDITIAVDGSLYKHHPRFKALMEKYIGSMTHKRFHLMLAEDGSGKGAGLVAAIAQRIGCYS